MFRSVLLSVALAAVCAKGIISLNESEHCEEGYELRDGACADIDECMNRPCKVNQDCKNTDGSYLCKIHPETNAAIYHDKFLQILEADTSPGDDHDRNGLTWYNSDSGDLHWWSLESSTPLTIHRVDLKLTKVVGATHVEVYVFHGEEEVGQCEDYPLGTGAEGTSVQLSCDQVLCDKVKIVLTSSGAGTLDIKKIKLKGSYVTKHKQVVHYFCPIDYPYAYYGGHYCCRVGYEKEFGPQGEGCDGGVINKNSMCCRGAHRAACKSKKAKGCAVPADVCEDDSCPATQACGLVKGRISCSETCQEDSCPGVEWECSIKHGKVKCGCAEGYIAGVIGTKKEGLCLKETCRTNRGICKERTRCVNLKGVYQCMDICRPGTERNEEGVCIDINECLDGSKCTGANQVCVNTDPGYTCDCEDGFVPEISFSGFSCIAVCEAGYSVDSQGKCQDVNECLDIPCEGNEDCINTAGSYECKERTNIVDVDEIATSTSDQLPEALLELEDESATSTTDDELPEALHEPVTYVCASNCWTRECDFCSSETTCGLKYDLESNALTIRTKGMTAKTYLKVALYSEDSKHLGTLSFNSRGVFLWGCIACRQLKARPAITSDVQTWSVEKAGNKIKISVDGTLLFEQEMTRGCAKFYGVSVTKIGFQSRKSSTVFTEVASVNGMEAEEGFSTDGCRT